jgi:replication-associated recombination protein RarA
MNLFPETPSHSNILTETYRPRKVGDFVGLDTPKKWMRSLIARPKDSAYIFIGPSGVGKTTLALAVADEMGAELTHIPSRRCTIEAVESVRRRCQYVPMAGKKLHLILIDEADTMTDAAQDAWLSILDSTNRAPNTVVIFTCNGTERLSDRFISRCFKVEFSSYGIAKDATAMLAEVWSKETNGNESAPNFQRIVKDSNNNIRAALMALEMEIDAALAGVI